MIKTDIGAPKVYDTPATANFTGDVMLDDDGSIKTYNKHSSYRNMEIKL